MIEIRELTKRYGQSVAVDRLSFTIQPGRITGFLGPNGAGKSTTMRMMLGLDNPNSGDVLFNGRAYSRLRQPLRQVGALLEARAFHPGRSGVNHLTWLARTNGITSTRVHEVIDIVGLSGAAEDRAATYSLGMAQRLGLAAALLGDPPVLLLDEPVNGLDPQGIQWFRGLVRRFADEGRTIFVSSHFVGEMAVTVDHLIVIARGRLLADASLGAFVAANSSTTLEDAFLRLTHEDPRWTV